MKIRLPSFWHRKTSAETGTQSRVEPEINITEEIKPSKIDPVRAAMHQRYAAAKSNRLFKDRIGFGLSVDETLRRDVERLRAASRAAGEDSGYIKRYYGMVQTHVVGEKGFRLESKIRRADGELDKAANSAIEEGWREFNKRGVGEISGRMDGVAADQLIAKSAAQDGDVIIRHIEGAPNQFGYAYQILEADLLDVNLFKIMPNGNVIKMGVEQDGYGRHIAYHIMTNHPGDFTWSYKGRKYNRIPADQITLPFPMWRPGQTRGIPWAHAALLDMYDIKGYREAILLGAKVGASNMLIYERDPEQEPPSTDEDWEGGEFLHELDPGKSTISPQGYKARESQFNMPDDSTGDFTKSILRGSSSAVEANYNVIANDYEGVSWSTLRQATIEDQEHWKRMQGWYISQVKNDIYERFVKNGLLKGAIPGLMPYDLDRAVNYKFHGRRWKWLDPLKDEQAIGKSFENFTVNPMDVLQDKGIDPEEAAEGWGQFLGLFGEHMQSAVSLGLIKGNAVTPGDSPEEKKQSED